MKSVNRRPLLTISLIGFAAAAVVLLIASSTFPPGAELYLGELFVFGAITGWCALHWSLGKRNGRIDLFELPVWFALSVFVFIGVSGWGTFFDPSSLEYALAGETIWLNIALLVVAIGIVAMWVGYHLDLLRFLIRTPRVKTASARRLLELPAGVDGSKLHLEVSLLVYSLSVASRLYELSTGVYGYFPVSQSYQESVGYIQFFHYIDDLGILALVSFALYTFQNHNGKAHTLHWLGLVGMVLGEVFFTFVAGVKGPLVYLLLTLFAVSQYLRIRISPILVGVLVVLIVLIFPVNDDYRYQIRQQSFDRSSTVEASQAVGDSFSRTWLQTSVNDNLRLGLSLLSGRQSGLLQDIAAIIKLTPEYIPYRDGNDYWILPLSILIPRVVWPEKPITHLGEIVTRVYLGKSISSSSAVTPFGDLYMHFGLAGIIIGMLLLGTLYRSIFRWLMVAPTDFRLSLYLALLFSITNYESDLPGLLQGLAQRFVVFYVVARAFYWHRERSNYILAQSGDRYLTGNSPYADER